MKSGQSIDRWFPLWIDKWLIGSTRLELIYLEDGHWTDLRGIFVDLLTLSKKDQGYIRANEATPYPLELLAGMFRVPLKYLQKTIEICLSKGKMVEGPSGIYYIAKTKEYSLSDGRKYQLQKESEPGRLKSKPQRKGPVAPPSVKAADRATGFDHKMTALLLSLITRNNPGSISRKEIIPGSKKELSWANSFRLMRERDERTEEEIERVLRWSQEDSFWMTVVLSPSKLRYKFDQLVLKGKGGAGGYKTGLDEWAEMKKKKGETGEPEEEEF